jgi:hypothetical protein
VTNRDFPPLAACLQTLEVLINNGGPNAIGLAEKAIDAFLEREPDLNRRTGDLHVLEQELDKIWKAAKGPSLDFVNTISDYTAKKMRELQPE